MKHIIFFLTTDNFIEQSDLFQFDVTTLLEERKLLIQTIVDLQRDGLRKIIRPKTC